MQLYFPLRNPILTQFFGARPTFYRQFGLPGHEGVDFRARTPQQCFACDSGKILAIRREPGQGYGLHIEIEHAWGTSLLAHLSRADVKVDQVVVAGIAIPGVLTGHSGQVPPHLHFGLKVSGVKNPKYKGWVNPTDYLKLKVA